MTVSERQFETTWLWRQAFIESREDCANEKQQSFENEYLKIRERVAHLVSRIAKDLPEMTVHDISHLDALWDTASLVAEGAVDVNPVESFVLGVSMLFHDAAMSCAAYPKGINQIKETVVWKDAIASAALSAEEQDNERIDLDNPSDQIVQQVLPDVLRQLHAEHAEVLAQQAWTSPDGKEHYLIEDSDLRQFYGPIIGKIAHSHWWPVHKVGDELAQDLGALANRTHSSVDCIKLACLLRVADALHLDSRRAPRFLRTITNPSGISSLHWDFQGRFAQPYIEQDEVVFTTGQPFSRNDAEAWWLAYDTIGMVDRELQDVDRLLQSTGRPQLKARRVRGAGSPERLSQIVKPQDWRPVDARLKVSDVLRVVDTLGGSKLYGDDPTVALRELIQNAADAVQARRKCESRPRSWGQITVRLSKRGEDFWLTVEDSGIGMSEQVLTGPLLDFGMSFWRSPLVTEELPGLLASGMRAIGQFGIGFFAVFMLGAVVRVYSRRYDRGQDASRLLELEFSGGNIARPILSPVDPKHVPMDGGTRVEVLLKNQPFEQGGLLSAGQGSKHIPLSTLVGAIAPNLDVTLETVEENNEPYLVARPDDWLQIPNMDLIRRMNPLPTSFKNDSLNKTECVLMRPLVDTDDTVFGRACISPSRYSFSADRGWVTNAGLRASRLYNVQGLLRGEALTATRNVAKPLVPKELLARWASAQAQLICDSVRDAEFQAMSAEVVRECGGDIGELKIVKWGSGWLNAREFEERLRSSEELVISFYGEFDYDEYDDGIDVHPIEFRDGFSQGDDVAIVLRHDGCILRNGNFSWPRMLTGRQKADESNVAEFIRRRIAHVWGEYHEKGSEERVVGGWSATRRSFVMSRYFGRQKHSSHDIVDAFARTKCAHQNAFATSCFHG